MNAADFRIDEPFPVGPEPDAPVRQTIHMSPAAAVQMADTLRMHAAQAQRGRWVELNIIGLRLVHPALESMIVRGKA